MDPEETEAIFDSIDELRQEGEAVLGGVLIQTHPTIFNTIC